MILAIDGPAASGKSTVARAVARRLGFRYLDTGAMYRAIGVEAVHRGVSLDDEDALVEVARTSAISFEHDPGDPIYRSISVNGRDVTSDIRSPEADLAVSPVARIPEVREIMVGLQRAIGREGDTVVEGRDIGTVVFPDAPVKVYLTASAEERARRRLGDHMAAGHESRIAEVAADIERRDRVDSTREASPLRQAGDAVLVDTTGLTVDQVVERIAALAEAVRA